MTTQPPAPQPSLIALLPCPFCGHDAPFIHREYDYETDGMFINVRCKCGVESAQQYAGAGNDCPQTYQEVRDRWNTRPQSRPEAELPEVTDEMVETGCIAAVEASGLLAKNWPEKYPDAAQLRKVIRAALQAAYGQQCAARRPAEVGGVERDAARWRKLESLVDPHNSVYWYIHPGEGASRTKGAQHLRMRIDAALTTTPESN